MATVFTTLGTLVGTYQTAGYVLLGLVLVALIGMKLGKKVANKAT